MYSSLFLIALSSFFFFAIIAITFSDAAAKKEPIWSWKKSTDSTPINENEETFPQIRLHLALRNEHLLDESHREGYPHSTEELRQLAAQHDSGCLSSDFSSPQGKDDDDEVSIRLALWRRIVSPSCENVNKAKTSLKTLQIHDKCEMHFDHFKCKNLNVATIKSVFGIQQVERVVEEQRGILKRLSVVDDESNFKLPEGISFVTNLKVGSKEAQMYRHSAVVPKEEVRAPKNGQYSSIVNSTLLQVGDSSTAGLPPIQTGENGGAPFIVTFLRHTPTDLPANRPQTTWFKYIETTVYCQDGSQPDDYFDCNSGVTPSIVEVQIVNTNAQNTLASWKMTASSCSNAGAAYYTDLWICQFNNIPVNDRFPLWRPVVIRARTQFSNSDYSSWTYSRVFYNQEWVSSSYSSVYPHKDGYEITANYPSLDSVHLIGATSLSAALFPSEFRDLYNVPSAEPSQVHAKSAIGIFEAASTDLSYSKSYHPGDLPLFMSITNNNRFNMSNINYVGLDPSDAVGEESQLDIELIASITAGIPVYFWAFEDESTSVAPVFEHFFDQLVTESGSVVPTMTPRPNVWSLSYGMVDQQQNLASSDVQSMLRSATKVAMLSSAGITVVVSSGDAGSSSSKTSDVFSSCFPSSVPYAVAVGGTTRRYPATSSSGITYQGTAAALGDFITSTGGVSGTFAVPSYQQSFASSSANPAKGVVQNLGRLTPDIAAIGSDFFTVINYDNQTMAGTSGSAPIVASLISLWNNRRLLSSSVGSPMQNTAAWIWKNTNLFADVGSGVDNCLAQMGSTAIMNIRANKKCWRTTTGFDLMTGWGEPKDWNSLLSSFSSFSAPPVWTGAANKSAGNSGGAGSGSSSNFFMNHLPIIAGVLGGLFLFAVIAFGVVRSRHNRSSAAREVLANVPSTASQPQATYHQYSPVAGNIQQQQHPSHQMATV